MRKRIPPASSVAGVVKVPGDKSISHRAVLLGAIAEGETRILGLSTSADVRSSLRCVEALGADVKKDGDVHVVRGRAGRFLPASGVLDAGNSGTTVRLLSGLLAGQPFETTLDGDASLRRRPMQRVMIPLAKMGATFRAREDQYLPLTVKGRRPLAAISYRLPVASAQVKSSILLAGLFADGTTRVREIRRTRDHTERMLVAFGAQLEQRELEISLSGPALLRAAEVHVPGDPSSAAFLWAAAALFPGAQVTVREVGVNPTRVAFLDILAEMGARVTVENRSNQCGEPVADVTVEGPHELRAIRISGEQVPLLIDELPLLAVLAAFARGTSEVSEAGELRVKESDRIATTAANLQEIGVKIDARPDGWIIQGTEEVVGGSVRSYGDHRIAMAMAIAGLRSREGVEIDEAECVDVSFPNFFEVLDELRQ